MHPWATSIAFYLSTAPLASTLRLKIHLLPTIFQSGGDSTAPRLCSSVETLSLVPWPFPFVLLGDYWASHTVEGSSSSVDNEAT